MKYLPFLFSLCAFLGLQSCKTSTETGREAVSRPNIIYILADDLGYGDVSIHGQEKFSTPNIDRLAVEGMSFTQHYSGSTVCAPSRGVLFTGLHTGHGPIRGNSRQNFIPDSITTMSEMFKNAGYVVGGFGKWGMGLEESGSAPWDIGFDSWYGYLNQGLAHHYYPEYLWRNSKKEYLEGNAGRGEGQYSFDLIHRESLKFLEENKDSSFFLYIPHTIPHAELLVPDDSIFRSFLGRYPETPFNGYDEGEKYRKGPYGSQEHPRTAFAAMVVRLDMAVGEILDRLEEYGIADNTLVIFTSDNGTHHEGGADPDFFDSNGVFRGYKRDLYEGGIRAPMFAWWPGVIEAGSSTDHISAFWDVFPTCADLVGESIPGGIDGISFAPTLLNEGEQFEHDYLYWEFYEQGGRTAIRKAEWKAVRYNVSENPDAPLELYNLLEDPGEVNNIAADHPELVMQLDSMMLAARTEHPVWKF